MRVLVTGGAGYIGSATVRRLGRLGHVPVVLDTLERGHQAAVEDAALVVGSVLDVDLVRTVLRDEAIDSVIHFAARKSVEESLAHRDRYFSTNVSGSIALLEAMTAESVVRLVYSSSAAVYGLPVELPVAETAPTRPENPYGETKLLVERILRWWTATTPLDGVVLRYFNAAGASPDGEHGEVTRDATNLIPVALRVAAQDGGVLPVFGTDYATADGTAVRDYVHVEDLADAHIRALDHLAHGGDSVTLNVGTGRGASVREVVERIRQRSGRPLPTVDVGRRPGDPAAVWADASLAKRVLGWAAERTLDDIVRDAWAWQERHPDGYGSPTLVPQR